jgi:hypothetical protein
MYTTSATLSLSELFSESTFTIPEIQRDFSWDAADQVSKLLEDMWKYHTVTDKTTVPQYFVGTIIVYSGDEHGQAFQIMDGQQRITSFTALIAAIKSRIEERSTTRSGPEKEILEKKIDEMEDRFLFASMRPPLPKLLPKTDGARRMIEAMIQLDGSDPRDRMDPGSRDKPDEASGVAGTKMFKALVYFYDRIYELALEEDSEDPYTKILEFYETICDSVVVTLTKTTTIGMAFQMFVSVNGQGMPLNSYDLMRGLLVAKSHSIGLDNSVGKELRELNKDMSNVRKREKKDTRITNCVRYWVEARLGKNIQENNVADELESEIREFTKLSEFESMIRQLRRFACSYSAINSVSGEYGDWPEGYLQHRRVLGFIGGNGFSANHMILYVSLLSESASDSDVDSVMSAVEWVNCRTWSQVSNLLENVYPWAANMALNEKPAKDWIDEFVEKLQTVAAKSDVSGFAHLRDVPVSESKVTVLLNKVRKSRKDPGKSQQCNACQYMPHGSPSPWNCQPERADPGSISGLLGNWFLMRDIQDKEIKNFPQAHKARVRHMVDNANTSPEKMSLQGIRRRLIDNNEKWNTKDIRNRTNSLIELLENRWPREFKVPK